MRVYKYGLLAPIAGASQIRAQLLLAHRYKNALTELEKNRRASIAMVQSEDTRVAEAEACLEVATGSYLEALRALKASRAAGYRGDTGPSRAAKEIQAGARLRLKEIKAAVRAEGIMGAKLAEVEANCGAIQRALRAECGVYWGTYLVIEEGAGVARKTLEGPKFSAYRGEGVLAAQIQVSPETTIEQTRSKLQIVPRDGGKSQHLLRLRVGSVGRDPIWGEWPILMHRPLPEGARIRWAKVTLSREGGREIWSVCFTVDSPDLVDTGERVVAVDVGWRKVGDEIRVASWVGSDGESGELRLPAALIEGFARADRIRGHRDQNLTDIIQRVRSHGVSETLAMQWSPLAHGSRRPGAVDDLLYAWRSCARPEDGAILDELEAWRSRDLHLWRYETGARNGAIRRRQDLYRVFAKRLADVYSCCVLESFDLRDVSERADTDTGEQREPQHQRQIAAVSELRRCLENKLCVKTVAAYHTTTTCSECGHAEAWNQARELTHTCGGCGAAWDQDQNAARNLLARASEAPQTLAPLAKGKRKRDPGVAKWAKRHADKSSAPKMESGETLENDRASG